jgi:very-short-patch-repair endonuclease
MRDQTVQSLLHRVWELARKQHGVVARRQLVAIGFTPKAIMYGANVGRLHRTQWRGVYSVGRPELSEYGRLMAAVLWAGPGAVLSHASAADLWGIRRNRSREITLSLPAVRRRVRRRGVTVHRRAALGPRQVTRQRGIPVTNPTWTLIDLATTLDRERLEAAVNQADARNLLRVDSLREELDRARGQPGVRLLRDILDRDLFVLTDSDLERLFVPIARAAGLERPLSQVEVNGHRVDFYFPSIDLVVECDSLRYHRTPSQQRKDRLRDQAHFAAETPFVRYTHWQIAKERRYVIGHLAAAAARLSTRSARPAAGSPSRGRSSGSRRRSSASP